MEEHFCYLENKSMERGSLFYNRLDSVEPLMDENWELSHFKCITSQL